MKTYTYFVEGECEQKLLNVIKANPSLIKPGKVHVLNVIQERRLSLLSLQKLLNYFI